jgi:seryl-tRNA synthetase
MYSGNEQDSDERGEFARVNRVMLSKKSDEYRQRRERNNAAVKKSRFKSKQKTIETQKRVEQLKCENAQLERRLESLSREFHLMRDIFIPRRDRAPQAKPLHQQVVSAPNSIAGAMSHEPPKMVMEHNNVQVATLQVTPHSSGPNRIGDN